MNNAQKILDLIEEYDEHTNKQFKVLEIIVELLEQKCDYLADRLIEHLEAHEKEKSL